VPHFVPLPGLRLALHISVSFVKVLVAVRGQCQARIPGYQLILVWLCQCTIGDFSQRDAADTLVATLVASGALAFGQGAGWQACPGMQINTTKAFVLSLTRNNFGRLPASHCCVVPGTACTSLPSMINTLDARYHGPHVMVNRRQLGIRGVWNFVVPSIGSTSCEMVRHL